MAYKVEIAPPPKCQGCGGAAKQTVYNNRSAKVGDFCNTCANRKVKELEAAENRGADDLREHRG